MDWLNSHASKFVTQLSKMGIKFNYDAVEEPLEDVLDEQGIHTGLGMCQIASAAIEEGVREKFGNKVQTIIVKLNTPKSNFSHAVTRITFDDGHTISVDGSHRQININAPGLFIIPIELEGRIFQTKNVVEKSFDGRGSDKVRKEIIKGEWRNITIEDYDDLVDTLTED